MPYDYSKLDGLITEKCKTRSEFAKKMELSEHSVSVKMNGKRGWTQKEIGKACEVLGIKSEDIPTYFFKLEVQGA